MVVVGEIPSREFYICIMLFGRKRVKRKSENETVLFGGGGGERKIKTIQDGLVV